MDGKYQAGVRDGIVCGLAMSAIIATQELPAAEGDALGAVLLSIAGVRELSDIAKLRGNPVDEYDTDYLACHFGRMGSERFNELVSKGLNRASAVSD